MVKIGLIGGIGPESTISYYRQIVHGVKARMGEKVLPKLSIETLSAFEVFFEAELEHGIVTDQTRAGFVAIIRSMQERNGIEQVILGCTELPLLLNDDNSPVPCLDTVDIHVTALVEAITRR